jgi:hypothetical protein
MTLESSGGQEFKLISVSQNNPEGSCRIEVMDVLIFFSAMAAIFNVLTEIFMISATSIVFEIVFLYPGKVILQRAGRESIAS